MLSQTWLSFRLRHFVRAGAFPAGLAGSISRVRRFTAVKRIGEGDDDLPVVARLVVEIRSDGRRTIARGAAEDRASGQKVAIEAHGDSPMQLALALARSLVKIPGLGARRAVRGLLGRGRDRARKK
ncbi:MAG TPA: hypothetical protein VL463_01265 [Kofleriaceae bacterium]|nr:hypothetical protein [Kofleriaceae bacterium]